MLLVARDAVRGYCFSPCAKNPGCYGGTVEAMRPGALLAVPSSAAAAVAATLVTAPAHRLLAALTTYGALTVDDTYWNATSLTAEKGVADEFAAAYGFNMTTTSNASGEHGQWWADMLTLFRALRVVVNNAPDTPGGGGDPLAPPPPPFCSAEE